MPKKPRKSAANPPPKPDPGGPVPKDATAGDAGTKLGAAKKRTPGKPEAPKAANTIIKGNGRARIAPGIKIPSVPCIVEGIDDGRAWGSVKLNTVRRHLTHEEKMQAIQELLCRDQDEDITRTP